VPGTLHPADAPRPTSSEAEKEVWRRLKMGLPSGWTAWHSLRIKDGKNFLGEGDFVIAHPQRGLLLLEVKGGQVEQRGGLWYQNGALMERSPLDQGRTFLAKLVRRLGDWNCQPPAWGAAVAFPDRDVDDQPTQDDLRGVVLGRNQLAWLDQWLPGVVEKALPPPDAARGEWLKRLHMLWGECFPLSLRLGTRAQLARERRLELDKDQLYALDLLEDQDRALVQGGAGTGKTLLAVEAARRQSALGRNVLLLCSTQPLAKWLDDRLRDTDIDVDTVSGLAEKLAVDGTGPEVFAGVTGDELWLRYFERAVDVCEPAWDAVVVDEAQDLPFEAWVFIGTLARGRRLWAFQDPGQCYWTDRAPPADLFPPPFKLRRGQRSPAGIEALAARYAGGKGDEAAIAASVANRELLLAPYPAGANVADRVGAEVDRLLSEGLRLADIGVVSLRGQGKADAVHQAEKLGNLEFLGAADYGMEDRLVADSFLRWKGLERPAIIVADVDPSMDRFATRMHIALTRASAVIRVVAPAGPPGWPGLG
jgi:hypothetical protein